MPPIRLVTVPPTPTVTIAIPVLDEAEHLATCLDAIAAQTYSEIVEILVIDGGSQDQTRDIAHAHAAVTLLENPARIQSCALNVALAHARGDIFVRVDGHCVIAEDYVERCVAALEKTGAAIVGGGMTPVASGPIQSAIAAAMSSRIGAGPAKFHHSTSPSWVDTVYLGAYRTQDARAVGGYSPDLAINEDAEFAFRMHDHGGIWLDPAIKSTYSPRSTLPALATQFFQYGRWRAVTVRRNPRSLSPRQVVAPALVIGLLSPWRRMVLSAYLALIVGWSATGWGRRPAATGVVLPAMHLPWGIGFLVGLVFGAPHTAASPRNVVTDAEQ